MNVYITIDTECSLGGAWENANWKPVGPERSILGKIGRMFYGIPLIMDILEEQDLRGTFFTEVLARDVVGRPELAEAYATIRKRGHDAQLHLHPVFHYYYLVSQRLIAREQLPARMDLIGTLPFETQLQLLEKGSSIFHDIFGSRPTAFRAGSYGASMSTLDALERMGIAYDSSFNAAYLGSSCLMNSGTGATNVPWRHGTVWEIPITTFKTGAWRMTGLKPLEVAAVSFREMQEVLNQTYALGQQTATVILHSFAFLKRSDVQFQSMRPDHLVIRRFRKFCHFLRVNRDRFRVLTFSEMPIPASTPRGELPHMGVILPCLRKLVQAANRIY